MIDVRMVYYEQVNKLHNFLCRCKHVFINSVFNTQEERVECLLNRLFCYS